MFILKDALFSSLLYDYFCNFEELRTIDLQKINKELKLRL